MTKSELITSVADRAEVENKVATKVVNALFEVIEEALIKDEKIQILKFGTFENRKRAAREARNLRTGKMINIKASKLPAFKASKMLKDAVNE